MKTLRHLLSALCLLVFATATSAAANPAKTLFGVELGSRFLIPACASGEDTMTSRICYTEGLTRKTAWGSEEHFVFYPRTAATPWARGEMVVDVRDGYIAAIHINTWGIQGQGTALEALTKKYGSPAHSHSKKIPALRSRIPSQFADWDLKDFSVRLDGTTTTIDWGRITLETHAHRKIADAKRAPR